MSGRERPFHRAPFWTLLFKELREVLRDRRAAFLTFIFPLLLYPLLFAGAQRFRDLVGTGAERGVVRVGAAASAG